MKNIFALVVGGVALTASATAFAGGRYPGLGTAGSVPQGAEQAYADDSEIGGGWVTASFGQDIPAGQSTENVSVAVREVGRALVATATQPGDVSETQLASN